LSALANKWGTTVKRLQELNNIKNANKIYVGQTIKYEQTGIASTTTARKETKEFHTIQKVETLSNIKTTVATITKLNPQIKDINKINQKDKIHIK